MTIGFAAISPDLKVKLTRAKVENEIQGWVGRTHSKVSTYPPQQPTRYRRTGTLGRGWQHSYGREGTNLVGKVWNPVRYAPKVQDEREQSRVMARKGWPVVQTIGRAEWDSKTLGALREALGHPF